MNKPFVIAPQQTILSSIPDIGIDDSNYSYNGKIVPRVTHILSEMLHEDSLMSWSNYIGLYKKQKYNEVLQRAADIGTYTHSAIERKILYNEDLDSELIPLYLRSEVLSAYSAFCSWWDVIQMQDYEVIYSEETLVCMYYGGTLDLLVKINGKIYLVDFKTSNHVGYKYHLQLAAYRRMLAIERNIHIDGCIILKLNKTNSVFEEYMIDLHNPNESIFMYNCDQAFMSLVHSYFYRHYVIDMAKEFLTR